MVRLSQLPIHSHCSFQSLGAVYLQNTESVFSFPYRIFGVTVRRPEAFNSIASGMSPSALFAASNVMSSQMKSVVVDTEVDHDKKDAAHEEEVQVPVEDRPWSSEEMGVEYEACEVEEKRSHEAALEFERQRELFANIPTRSYSSVNRTQSGPSSKLLNPDTVFFPPDHPYQVSRSSANISDQDQYPQHHGSIPPWSSSAYTLQLSTSRSVTHTKVISNPKTQSPSAVERESQGYVYRPKGEEMHDDNGKDVGNNFRYHRALPSRSYRQ